MPVRVNIDGAVRGPDEPHVSALDRGFLYGDSVYEVVRTYGGVPFALGAHLDRLRKSAGLLGFEIPLGRAELVERIRSTVTAAANDETYIRIVATRGSGDIGLDPALATDPRVLVIAAPLRRCPPEWHRDGIRVALVPVDRGPAWPLPGDPGAPCAGRPAGTAKSGNYLANVMALGRARRGGADEAILVGAGGVVTEGASSNVFVLRGGRLATPSLDCGLLDGITRRLVVEIARSGPVPVDERVVRPEELREAEEVCITSTLREIVPVVRVDDSPVGSGAPGPVARDLLRRFRERISAGLSWEA